MRQTCPPASLLTWSRDFPAVPPQAREARLFLAALLGGRRDADEAVLCLSELVGNACLHSRSREPGGRFTVRAQLRGEQLRVEVRDGGGPWAESRYPDDLHGRGLVIVSRLAGSSAGPVSSAAVLAGSTMVTPARIQRWT